MNSNRNIKKYFFISIKVIISLVLIYMLILKIGGRAVINQISLQNPIIFFAVSGIFMLNICLAALRWRLFIPFDISMGKLFGICFIGAFFTTCLPGGNIGGDGVKAYYLNKNFKNHLETGSKKNIIAIGSVIIDQYIGLFTLIVISMVAFFFGFKFLVNTAVKFIIPSVTILFIIFTIVILKFRLGSRFKSFAGIDEYLESIVSNKYIIFKAFLYSIIIQVSTIITIYILAKGLLLNLPLLSLFIFVPIITIVSLLPISISGIGLREGAFVILLGMINISPEKAVALSILWFLSIVVAGLPGLFVYLKGANA